MALRLVFILTGLVILTACVTENLNHGRMENMQPATVIVQLVAEPLQFTMSERNRFKISITARNQGSEVIDPELHRAKLFVNGKDSFVWNLAISNGKREAKWSALPPGETVSMSWSSMGESLFPAPGEFSLVLHYAGQEWTPRVIKVTAD